MHCCFLPNSLKLESPVQKVAAIMILRTPTSRFICFSLTLLLLLQIFAAIRAADLTDREIDDKDLEGLDELLALDEEEEKQAHDGTNARSSEAEILAKAQRIVLELSSENTMRTIDQNEYVLVLGYAPWCARSAELMPQFAEAATSLKDLRSPVLMAKLDAERYPKAASVLEIKGFPTILFFVNGTSQPYSGGFSSEEIVIWARKKTGVPVIRISSVSEAEGFLKKHHSFVVGHFEKFEGFDYDEFKKAAAANNELQFVEVSDSEVAKLLAPDITSSNKFLAIVKNEPEKFTKYEGSFEMDEILQFLEVNKFPLVTKLTEMNSVKVYSSSNKLQVILFAEDDELKNLLEPLQNIARKFKSKLMFIYVDINDENLAKPFLSLFGLEDSDETVMAAFDNGMSSKFLLESDLTESNIEDFCHGFLHGTLSPFYKSQPIPDNREASVLSIVGKTFDDLVLRSPKNVLLEVYTPWCINCETTSKHVEKLAKHFQGSDNLVFSKIDASANEHPKLQVNDYPTLLFYPVDNKENPIKLPTKSSLKELAASINAHLRSEKHPKKDEL